MQKPNEADETIDTGVEMKMLECEQYYRAGYEIAAIDALRFCRQQHLPLPDWLGDVVTEHVTSYLAGKKVPGKGRSASPLARYLARYKDHCRWQTVQDALSADRPTNGASSAGDPKQLHHPSAKKSTSSSREPPQRHAFEQARRELRGGIAEGSFKTMERAYWRVERLQKKGTPIYLARRDTLSDLGVDMAEQSSECPKHG